LTGNPCIPDYVKKESRGRAVVLQMFGSLMGEVMAMTVLFRYTSEIEPKISFTIAASCTLSVGVMVFFFVRDRKPKL
jgi:sugar phosphate permease